MDQEFGCKLSRFEEAGWAKRGENSLKLSGFKDEGANIQSSVAHQMQDETQNHKMHECLPEEFSLSLAQGSFERIWVQQEAQCRQKPSDTPRKGTKTEFFQPRQQQNPIIKEATVQNEEQQFRIEKGEQMGWADSFRGLKKRQQVRLPSKKTIRQYNQKTTDRSYFMELMEKHYAHFKQGGGFLQEQH